MTIINSTSEPNAPEPNASEKGSHRAENFFIWVTSHPKKIVTFSLIFILICASFIATLTKDVTFDAFLGDDNPALIYRNKIKEIFGLNDPLVIAVVNHGENGIYNPETLKLIDWLTKEVGKIPNIDPDKVTSLSTEKNIIGTTEGMDVDYFMESPPQTQQQANNIKKAILDFPLYIGSLVSRDNKATLIVAELLNESEAEQTYYAFMELVNKAEIKNNEKLHVAGEGAVKGYNSVYIDNDAQKINPLAALIITLVILFIFRRFIPILASNIIIIAALLITVGIMAASNTPFYLVTNVMPVILISISVADAIHIFSTYYTLQASQPERNKKDILVETMVQMWRPVTYTTLTTVAGFIGLYLASYMPPFKTVGLFSALGVIIAWIYSLLFLPALITILKPKVNQYFSKTINQENTGLLINFITLLGKYTLANSKKMVSLSIFLALIGIYAATQIQVNEDLITTFDPEELIYKADKTINKHLDGANYLDIVVESKEKDGLLKPENLHSISKLQAFAEKLPHVNGSVSLVDYLKQMNRAVNDGDINNYQIPESNQMAAQYFLLYSLSSDPADFEEIVDANYQIANVRLRLDTGAFNHIQHIVEPLQKYIDSQYLDAELKVTLTGQATLIYHWVRDLGENSVVATMIALFAVWLVSSLLFRSLIAGVYALLPVAVTILIIYFVMHFMAIPINTGTSMFSSIAIGLGIDFSIHILNQIKVILLKNKAERHHHIDEYLLMLYPSTGRVLFFNFIILALGFGVLMFGKSIPTRDFGIIISTAITVNFIISMTLLPALIKLFKPAFIFSTSPPSFETELPAKKIKAKGGYSILLLLGFTGLMSTNFDLHAETLPTGAWLIKQVNAVDDGISISRHLTMTLIDKQGKKRIRDLDIKRKYFENEKRTILIYSAPSNIKDTGFLTYDYKLSEKEDDQWLYLPSIRKIRRISASNRGDYFLGTDLTYEDIKKDGKIEESDYYFTSKGKEKINGANTYIVEAVPKNEKIAKELGYGRLLLWVDSNNWLVLQTKYWDVRGNELKFITVDDIKKIDGIWIRNKISVVNYKTNHQTKFVFSNIVINQAMKKGLFSRRILVRGF